MEKAFLCHSSADKAYVDRVAKRLGRAKVVFDVMTFREGHDFRSEIQAGLDQSALFVCFASCASLDSTWCRYELDEAHFRTVRGDIRGQLAIITDSRITYSDLPRWMQRLRAVIHTRAVQAAREIERELFALLPTSLVTKPFVGRQSLQAEFVERIAVGMESSPRVFVLSGLEGIGRRSYLERALRDNLGLTLGPYRVVDTTSALEDLYVWLLDETGDVMTREQLAAEIAAYRKLAPAQQADEVVDRLQVICEGRFVPCILDRGGVLDEDGTFRDPYSTILQSFIDRGDDSYLALLDTRAPYTAEYRYADRILQQRVEPLKPLEARMLLQHLMRREGISVGDGALRELEPYVAGYPPAVYFAARQARTYGLSTTLADKSLLVDFKARRFTRFLVDLQLTEAEWDLLSYLAAEQSVPLPAVAVALNRHAGDIAPVVRKLIDNSLIVVEDDNLAASPPIRDAVIRAKGHLASERYARIRDRLTEAFWADPQAAPSVEVVDATLHALARSGGADFAPYKDLVRPSVVHRLARESYFRREYAQALEYAHRAEQMGAKSPDVRAIHFKALVRLERWDDAVAKLKGMEVAGDPQCLYLKGFMLRRRRQFEPARQAYEEALRSGDNSVALHRDYADCLHRLRRYSEAMSQVKRVLARQSENIFVLDLALRIYLDGARAGEDTGVPPADVEVYLHALERFDLDRRFVNHRKATLFAHQQRWAEALEEAQAACDANPQMFEVFALRADVLIEMERFDEAESELEKLAHRFRVERDVQVGLRVKLLIRRGLWSEALSQWSGLRDKERPVHRALLMRIYELKSRDSSVPLTERDDAKARMTDLRQGLRIPRPDPVIDAILDAGTTDDDFSSEAPN